MKVICRKIISPTTNEDMGDSSHWLKKGKEYIVFALVYEKKLGFRIYIQTEHYNEPTFMNIEGFEFVNQKIPASWITVFNEDNNRKSMMLLPKSWNYESFFGDIEDEDPTAIALFNDEVEKIYCEELLN